MYLVVPKENIGMSDKDAAELVKRLNDPTPFSKDLRLEGIRLVEAEADTFAPSVRDVIRAACDRARDKVKP